MARPLTLSLRGGQGEGKRGVAPTVAAPCFLCGGPDADPIWSTPDRAFAVPGVYTVARCRACGFLFPAPAGPGRASGRLLPDHYPRHQEPSPRIPFKGCAARIRAVRWALASRLGYGPPRKRTRRS